MLKTTKTTSLTGQSLVKFTDAEGTIVESTVAVQFNATISFEGSGHTNMTETIVNQEAYDQNKKACRADAAEFREMVYAIEDAE